MSVIGKYDVHTVYCVIGTTVHSNIEATTYFYRPCREEREGYVFTGVYYQVTRPPSLPPGTMRRRAVHILLECIIVRTVPRLVFILLFCFDFVGGDAKQMYMYARANYRNAFIRFINAKDLTR